MYNDTKVRITTNITVVDVLITKFTLSDVIVDITTVDKKFYNKTKDSHVSNHVFVNSRKDFTVRITNKNSYPFHLKNIATTPGLSIYIKDKNFNPVILPKMSLQLTLTILFDSHTQYAEYLGNHTQITQSVKSYSKATTTFRESSSSPTRS